MAIYFINQSKKFSCKIAKVKITLTNFIHKKNDSHSMVCKFEKYIVFKFIKYR